jgi:hypothetical protein
MCRVACNARPASSIYNGKQENEGSTQNLFIFKHSSHKSEPAGGRGGSLLRPDAHSLSPKKRGSIPSLTPPSPHPR